MEIFLLLVVLVLIIVFHSIQKSKIKELQNKIDNLQKQIIIQLKFLNEKTQVTSQQIVSEVKKEEEKTLQQEIKVEPVKEVQKTEIPIPKEEIKVTKKEAEIPQQKVPEQKVITKAPIKVASPGFIETFRKNNPDLEKFIGENLLSKIAITILVLGIAFFVKYAIDKDWINETARVGIGILTGAIIMVFAHKLHTKFKAFSSILVAGAVAVFYFTIAIAFHEYHIFSQTVAFLIMVIITGFSVLISVAYDRKELAALALVGGFGVPLMLSTGEGNYKVLFTYILILDIGMLVLAYIKKWNIINILSYAFTVILYCAWLGTKVVGVVNAPYAGAFLFGNIFYLVFVLMNIVNNIKEKRAFTYVELIILVSNNFVFYIASMLALKEYAWHLKGIYTIVVGVFNFILAYLLHKKFKSDKNLVYLLLGMTLTFATLAAPVQLKGNYITMFWAAEALLLVWLAGKTQLKAFKLASLLISSCAVVSFVMDLINFYGSGADQHMPVLINKAFITGVFTAAAFFIAGMLLYKQTKEEKPKWYDLNPKIFGNILLITASVVAYFTGMLEIGNQSDNYIDKANSVAGICFFYHFAFTGILGILLLKTYSKSKFTLSFIQLCLNILIYTIIYSLLPYDEITDNCYTEQKYYHTFLFHFGSLLVLTAHFILCIKQGIKQNNFIVNGKNALYWIFGFFGIFILSNEVILNVLVMKMNAFYRDDYFLVHTVIDYMKEEISKTALPVFWGVISFTLLSIGIKRQIRPLRIMALVLLAITLIKLFTYDIKDVSEAGKIIAFILLGVLLLIMSFMYQKIKAILMDDAQTKNNSNNEENTNA
ncbi:MAG: DUF2339 domain-containing protein [Sphingobacteriaceae bacterium]|nr:DUF2339 domain-containing protein [Sphingobacteriaceae bacterium]